MSAAAATLITPRYRAATLLGEGSMGAVLRAHDRLAGQDVALKQVLLAPGLSAAEVAQELLTLAHEFRTLAGLRHPNIISVLDYGFDAQRRPFYTMELLAGGHGFLEAGAALPLAGKLSLLLQALEALAYLHRRGVLHHDLKPGNMLVADGRVRLLDFGLAVLSSQQRDSDAFGTLLYLAPEVLAGRPYTEQADLYSLGVVAYELLVGRYPFDATTTRSFLQQVKTQPPDLRDLAGEPALAELVGQLLAKTPDQRPRSADAAIALLRPLAGQAEHTSDAAIRESYLQAATFVGRARELAELVAALEQAQQGRGSAFLVGGESGVGKSRLLDELRTQALVAGFQVLRSQAVEGGGLSYQLWREPLRALLATAPQVDALAASVLLPLAPDLPGLLGRAVAPAPELSGEAALLRLHTTIAEQVVSARQPTLLLLEDLHWSSESLLPLPYLLRQIGDTPVVVVATYRNDEAPDLPERLAGMRPLALARLTPAELAQLSAAMLGEAGRRPELQELLARETEGNAFFAVEVVRALADQAGDLGSITGASLPRSVTAGGVRGIVARRLAKVPEDLQGLLGLMALAGREIEVDLLSQLAGDARRAERWLAICAEVAVIELQDGRWQFQHAKLREGALDALAPERLPQLHRQVAEALVALHGDDREHAARLAGHWRGAGDQARELRAVLQAADHAAHGHNHRESVSHRARALELIPAADQAGRFAALVEQVRSLNTLGERGAQAAVIAELSTISEQLPPGPPSVIALMLRARYAETRGQNDEADALFERASVAAQAIGDVAREAENRMYFAVALARRRRPVEAQAQIMRSIELYEQIGDRLGALTARNYLSVIYLMLGQLQQALDCGITNLEAVYQIGDPYQVATVLTNVGTNYIYLGSFDQARIYLDRACSQAHKIGARPIEAEALNNHGMMSCALGDYTGSIAKLEQCVALSRQISAQQTLGFALNNLAWAYALRGDTAQAIAYHQQTIAHKQTLGDSWSEAYTWARLGHTYVGAGDIAAAEAAYRQAEALLARASFTQLHVELWAGLADTAWRLGRPAEAHAYTEQFWQYVAEHGMLGEWQWAACGLAVAQIFQASGDPRAPALRDMLLRTLHEMAGKIQDPAVRTMFLSNVPYHRAILQLADA